MGTVTQSAAEIPMGPPTLVPRAAYLHIPFCAHKCGYCDFASVAGQDDRADAYLNALDAEMRSLLAPPALKLETVFVGGGTPTYLSASQLDTFLKNVSRWIDINSVAEFTVESNPNTLSVEKVRVLADHGVNRVSLGAQSFDLDLLRTLERNHDPDSVSRAVEMVRQRINNVSLDLIFGVPEQSMNQWEYDLDRMLALQPDHCSTYGLTYEKGTRLWRQRQLGIVQPVDEERERMMFEAVIDRLTGSDWIHYEVSNFARANAERDNRCRHNLVYWHNHAYYGFGTGAAAFVGGTRTLNIRDLNAYIQRCEAGDSPVSQEETLDDLSRARETAMLMLRLRQGVNRHDFRHQTGFEIDFLFGDKLPQFIEANLIEDDGATLRLSREGLFVADGILQAVL